MGLGSFQLCSVAYWNISLYFWFPWLLRPILPNLSLFSHPFYFSFLKITSLCFKNFILFYFSKFSPLVPCKTLNPPPLPCLETIARYIIDNGWFYGNLFIYNDVTINPEIKNCECRGLSCLYFNLLVNNGKVVKTWLQKVFLTMEMPFHRYPTGVIALIELYKFLYV